MYLCIRLRAFSRSHFLIDFHQNWQRRKNPRSKKKFVWGQYRTTLSPILPRNLHFKAKRSWKSMQILSNPISAFNIRESQNFLRLWGNWGQGTRWWHHILDGRWKYGCFAHLHEKYAILPLFMAKSPKFPHLEGNQGYRTRWWRQILDQKWKYGRFAHVQWKIGIITFIYGRIAEISAS